MEVKFDVIYIKNIHPIDTMSGMKKNRGRENPTKGLVPEYNGL